MISFVLAVTGFVLSVIVHCSTFLGIDPIDKFPALFLLHIGIFVLFGILTLEHKLTSIEIIEKRNIQTANKTSVQDQDITHAPVWMRGISGVCFIYAVMVTNPGELDNC